MLKQDSDKHNKSISGLDCKGPCYYPGTTYLHPLFEEKILVPDKATCPTEKHTNANNIQVSYDTCANPSSRNSSENELLMTISPFIKLKNDVFLKLYYNIYNMEDAIQLAISNTHTRITNNRLVNVALREYGDELVIINHRLVEFIKNYLIYHINIIRQSLEKYFVINDNNDVEIRKGKYKSDNNNNDNDKLNKYIIKVFVTDEYILKFMTKYIENKKTRWDDTENHLNEIMEKIIIFFENKIQKN